MSLRPEPRWQPLIPFGYAASVESMGSIAAPLLASVNAGVLVFALSSEESFRWPTVTLFLLGCSLLALLAAVQATFHARQYVVTPSEIEEWYPDSDVPSMRQHLREQQRWHWREHTTWAGRATLAYDAGLASFLLALATITVPTGPLDDVSRGRWAVVAVALLGVIAELAWIAETRWPRTQSELPKVGPEKRATA
jgi:hypothetical protein